METTYTIAPIAPPVLARLRRVDDAGDPPEEHIDPGQPLRCCLRRSEDGERLFLVSYAPLRHWARDIDAEPGPYLETGPVFIHAEDCGGTTETGVPPGMVGKRRVCRAYDADGRIRGGVLVETGESGAAAIDATLARQFADPATALVHVRAVEYGCFQFEARRS